MPSRPFAPLFLALAAVATCPAALCAQTAIDRVNDRFAQPATPDPPAEKKKLHWADDAGDADKDDDNFFGSLFGDLVGAAIMAMFDPGPDVPCRWPTHPYSGPKKTCLVLGDGPDEPTLIKNWSLRAAADYGGDGHGVTRRGAELFLDTDFYRLGFLAHVNEYRAHQNGSASDATLTDANVTVRLAQSNSGVIHLGIGGRAWESGGDTHGGVNVLARCDLFPAKPLHVTGVAEAGNLGSLPFNHLRAATGFTWRHGELFAGYDWARIGREKLRGPLVGLQLWF